MSEWNIYGDDSIREKNTLSLFISDMKKTFHTEKNEENLHFTTWFLSCLTF